MCRKPLCAFVLFVATLGAVDTAKAETVTINPLWDNSLIEFAFGELANALGDYMFAGSAFQTRQQKIKRAIMRFDVASVIPAGATINNVTLELHVSKTRDDAPREFFIHAVTQDWGNGTSNAAGSEGGGDTSTLNDVTWRHTFYRDLVWNNFGGDFVATASASTMVGLVNSRPQWSSSQMVADVQGWVDDPSTSFGWILKGVEDPGDFWATRRFGSTDNNNADQRPKLTIDFTAPSELMCRLGTVDKGNSVAPAAVLTVNGTAGDGARVVPIAINSPITVDMADAPMSAGGNFALYIWIGEPDGTTVTPLPKNLGSMCMPLALTGGSPLPFKTWNNIGRNSKLGEPDFPSSPAPSNVLNAPPGSPNPATAIMQGLILDNGSAADGPASITNAVILKIE